MTQKPSQQASGSSVKFGPRVFANGVSFFIVDETGVVFSEASQELYELNTSATLVWCLVAEGLSLPELSKALAKSFGFPLPEAREHVRRLLEEWRSRGLFAGETTRSGSSGPRITSGSPAASDAVAMPGFEEESGSWRQCNYRVLDKRYRVLFRSSEIEAWLRPTLAHLETRETEDTGEATTYYVLQHEKSFFVGHKQGRAYCCETVDAIAPLVKMVLFSDALSRAEGTIAIHAGAVGCRGPALVLPGPTGSGKSTLVAALVDEGLTYLSDDLVILNTQVGKIRGVPFSLGIKETGLEVLANRFPQLNELPLHLRPDGKRVRYMAPPGVPGGPSPYDDRDIGWIVFPRFDPDVLTELQPISASRALVKLTESCTLWRPVSQQSVKRFVSLVGRVPCFEMPVSCLGKAVRDLLLLCGSVTEQGAE